MISGPFQFNTDILANFSQKVEYQISKLVNDSMLREKGWYRKIPVRFYEMEIQLSSKIDRHPWNDHEYGTSYMGHGVAVSGSTNVGTICGFVRLQRQSDNTEEQGLYAVTCHHITPGLNQNLQSPAMVDWQKILCPKARNLESMRCNVDLKKKTMESEQNGRHRQ